jgi:hypothetical protein
LTYNKHLNLKTNLNEPYSMNPDFALGIEVNLNLPTRREPFCEERAKRLQRKARPGKRPKNNYIGRKWLESE